MDSVRADPWSSPFLFHSIVFENTVSRDFTQLRAPFKMFAGALFVLLWGTRLNYSEDQDQSCFSFP